MNTLQLPFYVQAELLSAEKLIIDQFQWHAHFNQKDYNGDWSVATLMASDEALPMVSAAGSVAQPTPLLHQLPYIESLLNNMPFTIESARLLRMKPGTHIVPHRDLGLCYELGCFRLHLPIHTSSGVVFIIDEQEVVMQVGELWYGNFDKTHEVRHNGTEDRIHLVIDGVRNERTDEWFTAAGFREDPSYHRMSPEVYSATVSMLRSQGRYDLIQQLEQQYGS